LVGPRWAKKKSNGGVYTSKRAEKEVTLYYDQVPLAPRGLDDASGVAKGKVKGGVDELDQKIGGPIEC